MEVKEKTYKVYQITNKVNGKIYIGKTGGTIENRLMEHFIDSKNLDDNRYFIRAIRKYGTENFTIKLLETFNDEKEALRKENFLILKKKSFLDDVGYNTVFSDDEGIALLNKETIKNYIKVCNVKIDKPSIIKYKDIYIVNKRYNKESFYFKSKNLEEATIASEKFSIFINKLNNTLPDAYKNKYSEEELQKNFNLFKKRVKRGDFSKFYHVEHISNSWAANLRISGELFFLGLFEKEEDAALAVDMGKFYIKGFDGVFYNFPEKLQDYSRIDLKSWFSKNYRKDCPTVPWLKIDKKYCVSFKNKKETKRFGQFSSLEEAIEMWDVVNIALNLKKDIYFKDKVESYAQKVKDFIEKSESEKQKINFIGIKFKKSIGEYEVYINHNKKRIYCGSNADPVIAAKIYDYFIRKNNFNKKLNFPNEVLNDISEYIKIDYKRDVYCDTFKLRFSRNKDAVKFMGVSRSYFWKNVKKIGEVNGIKFSYSVDNPSEYKNWSGETLKDTAE